MTRITSAILLLLAVTLSFTASARKKGVKVEPASPTSGQFEFFNAKELTHSFDTIPEGPQVTYDFEFKNVGKADIKITEAHGSCGCTVADWPHEPIAPKKKQKIHVTYNTDHRAGPIDKTVTITSDASKEPVVLHIRGYVTPKAQ